MKNMVIVHYSYYIIYDTLFNISRIQIMVWIEGKVDDGEERKGGRGEEEKEEATQIQLPPLKELYVRHVDG